MEAIESVAEEQKLAGRGNGNAGSVKELEKGRKLAVDVATDGHCRTETDDVSLRIEDFGELPKQSFEVLALRERRVFPLQTAAAVLMPSRE
jgi:hypothetical protein